MLGLVATAATAAATRPNDSAAASGAPFSRGILGYFRVLRFICGLWFYGLFRVF
jgi:hypothetical protein